MLRLVEKKVKDILIDPYRFKPLRKPMQNKRRVIINPVPVFQELI
jgi:mRNA interferase RelE/StbE